MRSLEFRDPISGKSAYFSEDILKQGRGFFVFGAGKCRARLQQASDSISRLTDPTMDRVFIFY